MERKFDELDDLKKEDLKEWQFNFDAYYDNLEDENNNNTEECNWDGLETDIQNNIWDVTIDGKKPFEYETSIVNDEYLHIVIYVENDDHETLTRYEADLHDMYSVPEDSDGIVKCIEDLSWTATGTEPIEENMTESLSKDKPPRSLGYAYTVVDIRNNASKIANESNKHVQTRQLKDLTSACRLTLHEVDDLIARLNDYSAALNAFISSSRNASDASTLADSLKNISI